MTAEMKQVGGVWLPAHETHLVDWMRKRNEVVDGKLTYQYHKLQAALKWVKSWRTAVDVGAHCGLWSMHLVKKFVQVHAFEPVRLHRTCFMRNVAPDEPWGGDPSMLVNCLLLDAAGLRRVCVYACALGEVPGSCSIHTADSSSGDSWVDGSGDIPIKRLDDLWAIDDLDFIKLDCEGYELLALRGGEGMLKRCRPCVIVEQKPGRAQKFGLPETGAVDYLVGLGAKLRTVMSGDYILSWD